MSQVASGWASTCSSVAVHLCSAPFLSLSGGFFPVRLIPPTSALAASKMDGVASGLLCPGGSFQGASSWWVPLGLVEPARWPSGACFFVRSQAWLHCGLAGSLPAALCTRGACLGSEGERMGKKKASHFLPSGSWLGLLTREVFCIRNGAVGPQDRFFSIRRNEAIIPRLASS